MTSGFDQDTATARGTVYGEDCDHMGHMNVAAYTRRYDEGTWALWLGVGFGVSRMEADQRGIAALESKVTYHRELLLGESFVIRSRFLWLRAKTAQFHHRMYKLMDTGGGLAEELAGTCTYTVACLDRTARKATPFPEDVAARIEAQVNPLPEDHGV